MFILLTSLFLSRFTIRRTMAIARATVMAKKIFFIIGSFCFTDIFVKTFLLYNELYKVYL